MNHFLSPFINENTHQLDSHDRYKSPTPSLREDKTPMIKRCHVSNPLTSYIFIIKTKSQQKKSLKMRSYIISLANKRSLIRRHCKGKEKREQMKRNKPEKKRTYVGHSFQRTRFDTKEQLRVRDVTPGFPGSSTVSLWPRALRQSVLVEWLYVTNFALSHRESNELRAQRKLFVNEEQSLAFSGPGCHLGLCTRTWYRTAALRHIHK